MHQPETHWFWYAKDGRRLLIVHSASPDQTRWTSPDGITLVPPLTVSSSVGIPLVGLIRR